LDSLSSRTRDGPLRLPNSPHVAVGSTSFFLYLFRGHVMQRGVPNGLGGGSPLSHGQAASSFRDSGFLSIYPPFLATDWRMLPLKYLLCETTFLPNQYYHLWVRLNADPPVFNLFCLSSPLDCTRWTPRLPFREDSLTLYFLTRPLFWITPLLLLRPFPSLILPFFAPSPLLVLLF